MPSQWIAVLCPGCSASLKPAEGGVICDYCGTYSERAVYFESDSNGDLESARIERLRRDAHLPRHPPSSLAHLFELGRVPVDRADRAMQELRARLAQVEAGGLEGEYPLHVLVMAIINEPWCDDSTAQPLRERAAQALTHPVYRQAARSSLCRAALKNGDVAAAEHWLSMLDPRPESIEADSDYRLTRAFFESRKGNYAEVLTLLGQEFEQVPIDGTWVYVSFVLRANAKERLGDLESARAEIQELRMHGDEGIVERIIEFNDYLDLCPRSRA